MSALAPIVLFAYSRPEHTRRTVEALLGNELAEESVLYVYSDAAKESGDQGQVDETRSYIRSITGFRNISIIEREENYGLARNISEGVTAICNKHGRAIVIEDDVVTSPLFLRYMNHALDRYADQKSVWHVSGWNYPIESDGLGDAFLWRVMNCWGWGTWADRWAHFSKNPERLVNSWDDQMIKRFNLDGAHDFWSQVTANLRGDINTWAIFWYATIFENNGLCLNPSKSFVRNVGHDGSGENCSTTSMYESALNANPDLDMPSHIEENKLAVRRVQEFYRANTSFRGRLKSVVGRIFR